MRTLKTLSLLLLATTFAMAQPNPDNMFISGYVTDSDGMAQEGHEVCVSYESGSPALPSDSVCTTTNANGWYSFDIQNGSVTGPNVTFEVSTYDPCAFVPLVQTRQNYQGTIDTANVNFSICSTGSGNCDVSFTSSNDSINGTWIFVANPTGTAPFTYEWWVDGTSYSTQTVSHMFNGGTVGIYVTVTDADSCTSTYGDTLYLDGNPNICDAFIQASTDSFGITTFVANSNGTPPFIYNWSNGQATQSIMAELPGVYCVEVTDNNGCVATTCDTIFSSGNNCTADFWYQSDPAGNLVVEDTVMVNYAGSQSNSNYYFWTVEYGGQVWNSYEQNLTVPIPPTLVPVGGIDVEICLTVTDSLTSCSDTYCETVTLVQPSGNNNCIADFSWYEDSLLGSPLPAVAFSDQSQDAASWYWDFGDNSFSTDQNPLHTYSSAGTYFVCLTIVNADQSCQQTYCDTVVVGNSGNGNCSAAFSNSGPTPIGYTFSANVQSNNLHYQWTIDNQYVGDGFEALAPGLTNGVHTVCLTVIDSLNNCSDTQCQTITVGSNNCFGYISGQLYAGSNNQPLDEGVVYLITHDTTTNQLTAVDSMVVDSGNYYFFGPLTCGDYMIKAAAYPNSQYYNNHIPTYYGNSPFWGLAQTVAISQVNTQMTADVTLIASNNPGGPGFIGGDVTQGANKVDPGDPIAGLSVVLFTINGDAVSHTVTDAQGQFGFDDLAYGTYQVHVEKLGVQTIPAVVTIGPEEPTAENINIFVSETLISTGITEVDFDQAVGQVFPNPVTEEAFLNIDLEEPQMVSITVLDLTGRTLRTSTESLTSGGEQIRVSTADLQPGYYLLRLQDADRKFSITRMFVRSGG